MLPSNLQSWGLFAYLIEKPGTKFLSLWFLCCILVVPCALPCFLLVCWGYSKAINYISDTCHSAMFFMEAKGDQWWVRGRKIKCTWCALQMRSKSCFWRKSETMSAPKVKDTPRSFSPQPVTSLSGSAHSRSHNNPVSGTSVGRAIFFIWSKFLRSGERPPCIHRIFSSIRAATGKQLKQSVKVFHKRMLKRRLHSS